MCCAKIISCQNYFRLKRFQNYVISHVAMALDIYSYVIYTKISTTKPKMILYGVLLEIVSTCTAFDTARAVGNYGRPCTCAFHYKCICNANRA